MMQIPDFDDKDLVIASTFIIGVLICFASPSKEAVEVVKMVLTGLFGLAVGRKGGIK